VLRTTGRIGKIDVDYQIEGRAVLMPNSCAAKFISHRSGQILELDHEIDLVYAQTNSWIRPELKPVVLVDNDAPS
jgi:hypothetical protein